MIFCDKKMRKISNITSHRLVMPTSGTPADLVPLACFDLAPAKRHLEGG